MAAWDQQPLEAPGAIFSRQPDYADTMAKILSSPGATFRAAKTDVRDYGLELDKLSQEKALREQELEVQKRGQDLTAAHYAATDTGEEWYGDTVPVIGKDGKPAVVIHSKAGNAKELPLPEGYTPTGGKATFRDMGTYIAGFDGYGQPLLGPDGQPIKFNKDLYGAGVAKAVGTAAGTAQASIPIIDEAEAEFNRSVDVVLNDPDLNQQIGPIEGRFPESVDLLGNRTRVRNNARKVMNNAFSVAYERLKGAGPISEGEGRAATAAIAQLDNFTVPDETYRGYLEEAKARVHAIAESQRARARLTPALPEPPPFSSAGGSAPAGPAPSGFAPPTPPGAVGGAPAADDPAGIR